MRMAKAIREASSAGAGRKKFGMRGFFVPPILTYLYAKIGGHILSDSLPALERQRSAILAQILDLGDFRSGTADA
jgi:hypothetical protein